MRESNVIIHGIEYAPIKAIDGEQKMIVCVDNRGLMFVGDVDLGVDDKFITIRNAQCIIRWGTSKHVAELVSGPLENTRLGAKEDVIVNSNNVVFAYVAGDGWCNE